MDEAIVTSSGVGDSMNDLGSNAAAAAAAFSASSQGRRVTLGGGNGRRDSLGLDAIGDALFGRRPSGFGMDLDGGFGGGALGRRGSMDSTTAVLDAAIMDLTRRRLSMAMGGDTFGGAPGGFNDPLMGMTTGMNHPMGMQFNMNMGSGLGSHMGGGGLGNHVGGNGHNNHMGGGLGNHMGSGLGSHIGAMTGIGSSSGGGTSRESISSAAASNAVNSINVRQQQLQEQQRELERRQKELELQRQQLLTAMEESRRVMQQMQQNMGQGAPGGSSGAAVVAQRTNSLLGSLGSGGLGANPGSFGGGGLGSNTGGLMGGGSARGAGGQEWFVCTICNSKAFSNREEALAHETICIQSLEGAYRRISGLNIRRSSLDLLGALAGASSPNALGSNPDRLRQQLRDVEHGRRNSDPTSENQLATLSNSHFTMMESPLPLAMTADKDWLTPLHCFVRRHCVEVFTASDDDVATPSKGKRKPIHVGQVGIRCPHCRSTLDDSTKSRERGSVYYPTTIASIYNATMNLLQRHLHSCSAVPETIMRRYESLKADDARSGTSKKYWVESALSLGLVDTPNGIRFSAFRPPPLPTLTSQQRSSGNFSAARGNDDDFFNSSSNALADLSQRDSSHDDSQRSDDDDLPASSGKESDTEKIGISGRSKGEDEGSGAFAANSGGDVDIPFTEQSLTTSAPLVMPEDEPYSTAFSFHLLSQMQPCVFTEADRLGKRKGLPPGFPGLACRHCFGGYGSGRFFPSSIKTLSDTSKTLNVLHNHMMRCRKCPAEVRDTLDGLRREHDEERAKMKFGSQKAFFAKIWDRLHYKDPTVGTKRKFQHPTQASTANQQQQQQQQQQRSTGQGLNTSHGNAGGNFAAAAAAGSHYSHNGGSSYFDTSNSYPGGLAGLSASLGGGLQGGLSNGYQNNNLFDTLAMHYAAGDLLGSNTRRKLQDMA
jgi:hypothetical protein